MWGCAGLCLCELGVPRGHGPHFVVGTFSRDVTLLRILLSAHLIPFPSLFPAVGFLVF